MFVHFPALIHGNYTEVPIFLPAQAQRQVNAVFMQFSSDISLFFASVPVWSFLDTKGAASADVGGEQQLRLCLLADAVQF